MMDRRNGIVFALVALACVSSAPAQDEEKETGWTDKAELGFVATAGNSESQTLGFKNTLGRRWAHSSFEFKAGGIRVESTTKDRFGLQPTPADPIDLVETEDTEVTAENWFANGRYDHDITERFYWYAGAGWERNRFSGIDNRYTAVGGVGNIWRDDEKVKFKTDYAATYTKQEDVVEVAGVDDTFFGLRFSWDYSHKFGESTEYVNTLVLDENLGETSDWRADMVNSIAVNMTARLALKVSLQLLYDNEPSFEDVPVLTLPPTDPGTMETGRTVFQLDELDSIFVASVVVTF